MHYYSQPENLGFQSFSTWVQIKPWANYPTFTVSFPIL